MCQNQYDVFFFFYYLCSNGTKEATYFIFLTNLDNIFGVVYNLVSILDLNIHI
jgi:hypothetical protein